MVENENASIDPRKIKVNADDPIPQRPLRLWPGVVIVLLQWLGRFGIPMFVPEFVFIGVLGGLLGWLAVLVWWIFFSRAPRSERWGALVLIIFTLILTQLGIHKSMRLAPFVAYTIPVQCLGFVLWAATSRRLTTGPRRAAMVITLLLVCGVWTFFKTGGITSEFHSDFTWRWAQTPEDRLLTLPDGALLTLPSVAIATVVGEELGLEWPGFRGPLRNGIVKGTQIETDWSTSPPVELWRRPIGPGWSSFAVYVDLLYTQEQRGEVEMVTCHQITTGEPVWQHGDTVRFWESNSGAGPRGAPTLHKGRVYTMGGTGLLNVLDARDGTPIWSRDVTADTQIKVPTWGFSSSPLVVDDVVIVGAVGKLIAYDLATGESRWSGPDGGEGYSSPHLLTIEGVAQVLLMSKAGAVSVAPADGTLLWEHPWTGGERVVQPALIDGADLLLSIGEGKGMRRFTIAQTPDGWTVEARWTSRRLRPNFNDIVIHKGHAFGFNGSRVACINIEDGMRKWQGDRYGGQLLLLPDQDLLLILSEKGELALVEASPEQFTELARIPVIQGKTWNHPALVNDILLVRNAQEMAAFRLPSIAYMEDKI